MRRGLKRGAVACAVAVLALVVGVSGCTLGRSDAPQRAGVASASTHAPARTTPVVAESSAASGQARHSTTQRAQKSTPPARRAVVLTACDQNIKVEAATTTCAFAQNAFYEYWHRDSYGDTGALRAYSPAAAEWMRLSCTGTDTITCRTHDRGLVRFPAAAVAAYTVKEAARYAASPDRVVSADPGPSADDGGSSSSSSDPSLNDNSSDPSFSDPSLDDPTLDDPTLDDSAPNYSLPVNSDDYSNHDGYYNGSPTTEDFGDGAGSVGQCADGTYSDSIGRPGACSHHGGVG
jgi:hypothetical protein